MTGPTAINNVAGAMSQVAGSMAVSVDLATPTHRVCAVKQVVSDKSLSTPCHDKAILLFSHGIVICNMYIAIDDNDVHNKFLAGVIVNAGL